MNTTLIMVNDILKIVDAEILISELPELIFLNENQSLDNSLRKGTLFLLN
jgi:hypothetical protein